MRAPKIAAHRKPSYEYLTRRKARSRNKITNCQTPNFTKVWNFCLPTCLITFERLEAYDATHGHQTWTANAAQTIIHHQCYMRALSHWAMLYPRQKKLP